MKHNPRLSLGKAKGTSTITAQNMTTEDDKKYFHALTTTLKEHDLLTNKDVYVLFPKEKEKKISAIPCSNAEGNFLRSYCTIKSAHIKTRLFCWICYGNEQEIRLCQFPSIRKLA
jgi:hypothetical protein